MIVIEISEYRYINIQNYIVEEAYYIILIY